MHLKMLSAKWQAFCLSYNVLIFIMWYKEWEYQQACYWYALWCRYNTVNFILNFSQ